jgi:hypothetical protein
MNRYNYVYAMKTLFAIFFLSTMITLCVLDALKSASYFSLLKTEIVDKESEKGNEKEKESEKDDNESEKEFKYLRYKSFFNLYGHISLLKLSTLEYDYFLKHSSGYTSLPDLPPEILIAG